MTAAKAAYAAVFAALTAAAGIWTTEHWLVVLLAAVTAVGVYFVPNKPAPAVESQNEDLV